MEFINDVKELWLAYYPVVVGGLVTIGGLVAGGLVVWRQVSPIIEKITSLGKKIDDNKNAVDPLKLIQQSTMMTDLKSKLDNPTISDALKLQYQQQLFALEKLVSQTSSITDKVEDVTNKFL